ncbi:16S rRNA (uracil(1498)-N(3))-methyltransferase [Caldichromatium japonicum]|uniref:Ribosomal RNA small subunit methyltransferase E n=1 Tax=Caldichromatium japonicum TaxID=2699430 RepID=A0A6G7VFA1_9GAMM|nr:16S rRNA (uracil(1498)-N(3))-methyltransferase [Caldichromatium japonicum]QIK38763.1 16S rRNA (uracil(1498)-N(3))-methyltransferase [Caldichromatium japonicum]
MRIPRLYCAAPLSPGALIPLPEAQARHAAQVLRLQRGDPLILFNGDGNEYPARLLEAGRGAAQVRIEGCSGPEPLPPLAIQLALGIARGERMDLAIQKAVELGVTRIRPLVTRRVQVQLAGSRLEKRLEHWQGVIIAACEQSGRCRVPVLEPVAELDVWLSQQGSGGWLLDPQGERALTAMPAPAGELTLLIGPEGGVDPAERELARRYGFSEVRLGPRILRVETAPLAAIAVIQALWGDLGA